MPHFPGHREHMQRLLQGQGHSFSQRQVPAIPRSFNQFHSVPFLGEHKRYRAGFRPARDFPVACKQPGQLYPSPHKAVPAAALPGVIAQWDKVKPMGKRGKTGLGAAASLPYP